jgi:hypothetical protein
LAPFAKPFCIHVTRIKAGQSNQSGIKNGLNSRVVLILR